MKNNNSILEIVLITIGVITIITVVGIMLTSDTDTNVDNKDITQKTQKDSEGNKEELNTITASSSVDTDIDAYLNASRNVPSSNDFNDSYADLSQ